MQKLPENVNNAYESEERAELKEKVIYGTGCLYELTKWLVVIVVFFSLIHFFVATILIIDGVSMEPNFHTGQLVVANRWQYHFGKPERGDAVMLKFPGDPENKKYIKRIIGMPGEKVDITNGDVFINNKKLVENYLPVGTKTTPNVNRKLKNTEYFLMGDNRLNSSDSRVWGAADKRYLIGKGWIILWPFDQIGKVTHYTY